ncbi:hypothetical protein B0H13DRAFT_2317613 [Mycena leptocephala]|nr:hypothetical protein B0H13DRAFT_2371816 [Mycena leptocephala]KAJ7922367.1 hypothetical protein B0H13DRAFT_2317613 [Mycena leptocephala]
MPHVRATSFLLSCYAARAYEEIWFCFRSAGFDPWIKLELGRGGPLMNAKKFRARFGSPGSDPSFKLELLNVFFPLGGAIIVDATNLDLRPDSDTDRFYPIKLRLP